MFKQHKFWAVIACIGMGMCMITGHSMVSGRKKKSEEESE